MKPAPRHRSVDAISQTWKGDGAGDSYVRTGEIEIHDDRDLKDWGGCVFPAKKMLGNEEDMRNED